MKFIHAVVFDKTDFENSNYNTSSWDDLTSADYTVHCLYNVDNEDIVIIEDNMHTPVETMIENFLDGVRYAGSVNVGGLIVVNSDVEVINAYIVVDDGLSYRIDAVGLCLVEGNYVEVK